MPLSATQMVWASFLRDKGTGEGQIARFSSAHNLQGIPIFHCRNEGGLFAATIGLMDVNQARPGAEPVYTELLLAGRTQDERICNVLSAAALSLLEGKWQVRPGLILESVVSAYMPEIELPHLYFTYPDQYKDFDEIELPDRKIHPLVCFPISDEEAELVRSKDGEALESLWEEKYIDPVDWTRASSV
jgi:hypothetical protein